MYFLLSGEGPTDMGLCTNSMAICEGDQYEPGPMAIIVSQIVMQRMGFSFIENRYCGFISRAEIVRKSDELKPPKKSPRLPGSRTSKETLYFYSNARALAKLAIEKRAEIGDDDVIAVLFRDSDDKVSEKRTVWEIKRKSIEKGFQYEGFEQGVPMVPRPKSEAWIICAVKNNRYQNCGALENPSGKDGQPKVLKDELAGILGYRPTRQQLCDMVNDGTIDVNQIDMPSFGAFKQALVACL